MGMAARRQIQMTRLMSTGTISFTDFLVAAEAIGEAGHRGRGMSCRLRPPSKIPKLPGRVPTLLLDRPEFDHKSGQLLGDIQRSTKV